MKFKSFIGNIAKIEDQLNSWWSPGVMIVDYIALPTNNSTPGLLVAYDEFETAKEEEPETVEEEKVVEEPVAITTNEAAVAMAKAVEEPLAIPNKKPGRPRKEAN